MKNEKPLEKNKRFVDFLVGLGKKASIRERFASNKNWFRGYYFGLDKIIRWYAAMINPTHQQVIEYIEQERKQTENDRERESDRSKRFRMTGCIQSFNDILEKIASREAIP